MSSSKICNNCKLSKNVSEFVTRKRNTGSEYKTVVTSICKDCNRYKSKLYYHFRKNINKEENKYYLYRFLSKDESIIYIGKTSNLIERIRNHLYGNGGLSQECYKKLSKIQILKFNSQTLRDINEIYYINIFKPFFNKEYKYNEDSVYIKGLGYDEWIDLDIESMFDLNNKKSSSRKYYTQEYSKSFIELETIPEINNSNLYIGKASIFMRERNNRFIIYAEYFNSHNNKNKQLKLSEFDNKNIAKFELEKIKEKKNNGIYTIDIKKRTVI